MARHKSTVPNSIAGPPHARIGPLPPDLEAAFTAAMRLVNLVDYVKHWVRDWGTEGVATIAWQTIEELRAAYPACKATIESVAPKLTQTRGDVFRLEGFCTPNAHLAAVYRAASILTGADLTDEALSLPDANSMAYDFLLSRVPLLTPAQLASEFRARSQLAAEIEFEATKASKDRRKGQPGRPPSYPRSINLALAKQKQTPKPKLRAIYNECRRKYPAEFAKDLEDPFEAFKTAVGRAKAK
jgi:hypothetical protein